MATMDQLRKTKLVAKKTPKIDDAEVFFCVNTLQVNKPIIDKIYIVIEVDTDKNTRSVLSIHKKVFNAEEAVRRIEKNSKSKSIYLNILEHEIID